MDKNHPIHTMSLEDYLFYLETIYPTLDTRYTLENYLALGTAAWGEAHSKPCLDCVSPDKWTGECKNCPHE